MDWHKFWEASSAGIYAMAGAITVAVLGFLAQRRKQGLDSSSDMRADLSKSERSFRIDILSQLREVRTSLAECQDHRAEAVAMNTALHMEVDTLRARVRELTRRVTGEDALLYRTEHDNG